MKNASLLFFTLFATFSLFGQNRNGISYQALIASPVNENGISISLPGKDQQLISYRNREVCLRFSFLDSSGNIEYIETQQASTDIYGMVNLVIGTGTPDAGYSWDNIAWTAESKSLIVDVDYGTKGNVSCDNFVRLSIQELTAVPFALYAPSAKGSPGPEGPEGDLKVIKVIKVIPEIKDRKVYKDLPVLLDPLDHKEKQDLRDLRVIKVILETKDRKVYKDLRDLRVTKVTLETKDPLDHKEKQDLRDLRVIKVTLETKDLRVTKVILEIKDHKAYKDLPVLWDPLDHKEKQDLKDQKVIKVIPRPRTARRNRT